MAATVDRNGKTKRQKQDDKLAAAATKRQSTNRRYTLDASQLPARYSATTDGEFDYTTPPLVTGRPWT